MCFLNVYWTESSHWCSFRSQSWIETRDSYLGSGWSNRRGEEASSLELMHLNFSFSANWTEGYKESKAERKEEAGSERGFTPGRQGEFSNFRPMILQNSLIMKLIGNLSGDALPEWVVHFLSAFGEAVWQVRPPEFSQLCQLYACVGFRLTYTE